MSCLARTQRADLLPLQRLDAWRRVPQVVVELVLGDGDNGEEGLRGEGAALHVVLRLGLQRLERRHDVRDSRGLGGRQPVARSARGRAARPAKRVRLLEELEDLRRQHLLVRALVLHRKDNFRAAMVMAVWCRCSQTRPCPGAA